MIRQRLRLRMKKKMKWTRRSNASVKLVGYLTLIADLTHNITDGLAMS